MTLYEMELNHLKKMLEPPYTEGWEKYCLQKAKGMENRRPELYAGLADAVQLHASLLQRRETGG
jgi:hypothetical protein